MVEVKSYKDLVVWQKAMDMVVQVYEQSKRLPAAEKYGLTAQLTRAAASVPANIAEGSARSTARDYAHFLGLAKGSLLEAETFLMLTVRLGFLRESDLLPAMGLITEISKMLNAMQGKLNPR